MKKNNLTEKEFTEKLIDSFMKLIDRADLDKFIYGNAFWEFTNRKIELIKPEKVTLTNSKTKKANVDKYFIQKKRLTKSKLYGKSILNKEK